MRILQVIHDFLPHHAAGAELYCFYLSRQLAKRHSVYLMFTEVDHAKPQYYHRRSSYMGLPFYEVTHNHVYRRFEDTYADPAMDRVFASVLDDVRPDVVHFQHLLNHSIDYIPIARKRGIPVVFTLHDYWLSCPNGGQRIRPDLHVCEEIETDNGSGLIERLPGARVDAPREEFVRRARFALEGELRDVLVAHPPASVSFDLNVAAGTRLHFGVGGAPGTFDKPGGGVEFEVRAGGRTIWQRDLDPKRREEERRWIDDVVTLPSPEGGRLQLQLLTRPLSAGDNQHCTAGWTGLRLQEPPTAVPARLAPAKALYRAVERFLSTETREHRAAKVQRRLDRVREACRQVDLFISPSSFLKERMVEFGLPSERVLVSDNGLQTDLLQPFRRRPSDRLRFGYVGTLAPHKGVHVLLEAFERLVSRSGGGDAVLKIWGSLSWFPDYVRRLRSLSTTDRVEFLGEFDNQDALEVYADLDVLVVPSIWWENSPITIHEAILTGTPILASDFGGMRDFVRDGENGLLFEVGDAEDLARKMGRLVEDPACLESLRKPVIPIKTSEDDAAEMERRYLDLVGAPAVAGATAS